MQSITHLLFYSVLLVTLSKHHYFFCWRCYANISLLTRKKRFWFCIAMCLHTLCLHTLDDARHFCIGRVHNSFPVNLVRKLSKSVKTYCSCCRKFTPTFFTAHGVWSLYAVLTVARPDHPRWWRAATHRWPTKTGNNETLS